MFKFLLTTLLLSGCFVNEKKYKSNISDSVERNFNQIDSKNISSEQIKNNWWNEFDDDCLSELIQMATKNNRNIKIAQNNVLRSRIALKIITAGLFPEIGGNLSNVKLKADQFGQNGLDSDLFIAGFDAKWELDIFGKKLDQRSAAKFRILKETEKYNSILLTLNAEIAKNYFKLRKFQNLLKNQKEIIEINEKITEKSEKMYSIGYKPESYLINSKIDLENEYANIKEIEYEIKNSILQLSLLCGIQPLEIEEKTKENNKHFSEYNVEIVPVGLKSDLLKRRPDIMIAEYELNAKIKELKLSSKNFLPSFSITGLFGYSNTNANVFDGSSAYLAMTSVKFPIFQAGKLVEQYKDSKISTKNALLEYENAVINALKDVESSLSRFLTSLDQEYHIKNAFSLSNNLHIFNIKMKENDQLDEISLLTSRLANINYENRFINAKEKTLISLISLHKELGGKFNLDCDYEKKS